MIKRTLLAAAILSALPAYAGLTSITAGYDFTDCKMASESIAVWHSNRS